MTKMTTYTLATDTRSFLSLFSTFLLSLKLSKSGLKVGFLISKSYPFAFSMEDGVKVLTTLELDPGSRAVSIKCHISESRAKSLLAQFMVARLIHCPEDRTRDSPAPNVPLQPTAKGLYVLSQHLQANPVPASQQKNVSALLSSNYNTMTCVTLVRDSNDVISTSKYLTLLLFQRLAGKTPNLYSANDIGDLEDGRQSPYHHRYFTHPDSEAVTQYYVSSVGVRLLETTRDCDSKNPVFYFSGKAAWQWIMECCEVVKGLEIIDILQEFTTAGFIERLNPESREYGDTDSDSISSQKFVCSKAAKYCFTVSGMSVAGWTSNLPATPLSSGFPKFVKSRILHGIEVTKEELVELQEIDQATNTTLDAATGRPVEVPKDDSDTESKRESREERILGYKHENPSLATILQDPGLTLLFRDYLESSHCVENHTVYVSTHEVICAFFELTQQHKKRTPESLASLLDLIYSTYDSYLSPQAPKEFNMTSTWRDELCLLTGKLRTVETVSESLLVVTEIVRVFDVIKTHAFRIMEIDSLPKFLECREYRRCLRTFRWLERVKYVT
ncbi:Protein SST2 [Yarrowia sp. C11]|nr:Protein SST2 [Yarrowia sp. E02]KAG5367580.1 Protein SST2 [Yarrowia sp. C11]